MTYKHHVQLLDTVGDESGTRNANGNYSSAATTFRIQPYDDETIDIYRLIIEVEDTGSFDAEKYGNNITLTNGIVIQAVQGVTVTNTLSTADPITTNANWGRLTFDVDVKTWGTGDEVLLARWSFDKFGPPLRLHGADGDALEVVLNDDFTGLVKHTFTAQGGKLRRGTSTDLTA